MKAGRKLKDYTHKVNLEMAASSPAKEDTLFQAWFDGLPSILAGKDVREIVDRWVGARQSSRPVVWGFGAHIIKVGLSRWIITLMEEGLINHLAVNGAVAIHDFEMAAVGHTSEEVEQAINDGIFGRSEETALFINRAAAEGLERGLGLGESLSLSIENSSLPNKDFSVLAAAARFGVKVTVHLALGTDTVHCHPSADGKALGQTTLTDYHRFADVVSGLDGGLYFNVGSAVILPEIFLKAVSQAKASGTNLSGMTTVVLDFIRHYRPLENVTRRPVSKEGRGFYLIGHHEIMVPLIGQAVLNRWLGKK